MKKFLTVRQTAQLLGLSEYMLRRMAKAKTLPCIYSGSKCLINISKLCEQLEISFAS